MSYGLAVLGLDKKDFLSTGQVFPVVMGREMENNIWLLTWWIRNQHGDMKKSLGLGCTLISGDLCLKIYCVSKNHALAYRVPG